MNDELNIHFRVNLNAAMYTIHNFFGYSRSSSKYQEEEFAAQY